MSYTWAKDNLTETDLKRFACCFLTIKDMNAVDWNSANAQFGGKATAVSFRKTVVGSYNKAMAASGGEAGNENGDGKKPAAKGKGGGGKKRKAADEDEAAGSGDEKPAPRKKAPAKKGKKAKAEITAGADGEAGGEGESPNGDVPIKDEGEEESEMT